MHPTCTLLEPVLPWILLGHLTPVDCGLHVDSLGTADVLWKTMIEQESRCGCQVVLTMGGAKPKSQPFT